MNPTWFVRSVRIGDKGPDVSVIQRLLGLIPDGVFGISTQMVVRGFQRGVGLPLTGIVDDETAIALGPRSTDGIVPEWFIKDIHPGELEYDIVLHIFGDEAGLRRFQGNHGRPPTGVVDETTARLIEGLGHAYG